MSIPGDIATHHLERLKGELENELHVVEEKITDLESGKPSGIVSPVEQLASILHALASVENVFDDRKLDEDEADAVHRHLDSAKKNISVVLDGIKAEKDTSAKKQLSDVLGAYRSRLMNSLNTLDLVSAAFRKHSTVQQVSMDRPAQKPASGGETQLPKNQLGSSAIIRSQELERQRIAREIHDGPAQAIANVVLRMDILSKIFEKDPERIPAELAKMKEIAQGALDEIRGFIFDLRPMTLQDLGLVATIRRITNSLKEMTGLNVRFIVEGEERSLGSLITLTVFRIAQEAITNVRKNSECQTAWVHLKYLPEQVVLIVEDDGVGFDIEEVAQSQKKYTSFGLLGMQERADDINADLTIDSVPGKGAKIILVVPTEENPAMHADWEDPR